MLNARSYFSVAAGTAAQWTAVNMTLPADVDGNYTVTVAADNAATPPTYTVTAAPKGAQATKDAACGSVKVNNTGTKMITGSSTVANCWK